MNDLTHDWKLRELAGLDYAGKDEDGENEWVGTEKSWRKYQELSSNCE